MKTASKPSIAPIRQSKEAGFTFIELFIVIAIVGILASFAIPSFRGFIVDQRVKTASFDIMAMLTLARSEAVKRNKTINTQEYSTYYQMKFSSTTLLKLEKPVGVTIQGKDANNNNCSTIFISYQSTGRLPSATGCIKFDISSTASALKRCISIDLSGRPTVKNTAC